MFATYLSKLLYVWKLLPRRQQTADWSADNFTATDNNVHITLVIYHKCYITLFSDIVEILLLKLQILKMYEVTYNKMLTL